MTNLIYIQMKRNEQKVVFQESLVFFCLGLLVFVILNEILMPFLRFH